MRTRGIDHQEHGKLRGPLFWDMHVRQDRGEKDGFLPHLIGWQRSEVSVLLITVTDETDTYFPKKKFHVLFAESESNVYFVQ